VVPFQRGVLCGLAGLALVAAGCATMAARTRLEELGARESGRFYKVERVDFEPAGTVPATASNEGSTVLLDAIAIEPGIQPFIAEHGVPDGVAVEYQPQRRRTLAVMLGYLSEQTVYVFHGKAQPLSQRALIGSELLDLDPERRVVERQEVLEAWLVGQARIERVAARMLRAQPHDTPPAYRHGVLLVPGEPAVARHFGHPDHTRGLIVAWVDPDGASQGRLRVGDRLIYIDGQRADALPPKPCTVTVERDGAEISVDLDPEPVGLQAGVFYVDSAEINAFCSGRTVVVTSGMLQHLTDDDQLAFVLGHELTHEALGHCTETSTGDTVLAALGIGVLLPAKMVLPGIGQLAEELLHGLHQRYNRDQERAADRGAVHMVRAAGYDPTAGVAVIRILQRESPETPLLDIHPPYEERQAIIAAEIESR
jgi:hypothetical protein